MDFIKCTKAAGYNKILFVLKLRWVTHYYIYPKYRCGIHIRISNPTQGPVSELKMRRHSISQEF